MRLLPTIFALVFGARAVSAAEPVEYLRDVKPILARNCVACHGAKLQMAGLRLDTGEAILRGGKAGPVVAPGRSGDSKLIGALRAATGMIPMPFGKSPLPDEDIARLAAWIDAGARVPEGEKPEDGLAAPARHWSFQPPQGSKLPDVRRAAWARNEIDRFILARLEREGLQPSPEADRLTLIRRVSLDLTGLPPTLAEIDQFVADKRPDAYERLVDRLLASPHYGERWARNWLDLARYADSNGYSIDGPRQIWKYRDWVIDALNRDLPFDRFAIEQLAGDLLPNATVEQKIATGFHRNTPFNQEGGIDLEQFRIDSVADRVATTGTVFLGLTLGCARCHDHKYDPISQKEYYRLFAFFNNADEPVLELASPEEIKLRAQVAPKLRKLQRDFEDYKGVWLKGLSPEKRAAIPREIEVILVLGSDQRDDRQIETMFNYLKGQDETWRAKIAAIEELRRIEPKYPTTLVMAERAEARETHVHLGGDFTRPGDKVDPGVPAVLHPLDVSGRANRLDLARWLVDARNPLVGRVTMNRFWQHYFGRGLVETENDFGTMGSAPTHPELLDWLATEFPARGWSMKAMHRLIVTSAVYRQVSRARPELTEKDPTNRWLGRQSRLRLDAEAIRDSALEASGLLDAKVGGPSIFPPQPDGVFGFTQIPRVWTASRGSDRYRRGVYVHYWRSAPHPALVVFDAPDATATCTRRNRSTTPMQALTLLNDPAYVDLARGLAGRMLREAGRSDRERIAAGFRFCTARSPRAEELSRLERFLAEQRAGFRAAPDHGQPLAPEAAAGADGAAWTALARVLLNLDEFITRE
jgi:mono/diheme cytochrome c family protein